MHAAQLTGGLKVDHQLAATVHLDRCSENGSRVSTAPRAAVAVWAIARLARCSTSQRLVTSRAVNHVSTTARSGRMSGVLDCARSPSPR